jgi:hypothetical protein
VGGPGRVIQWLRVQGKTSGSLTICFQGGVTIVKLPRSIGSKSLCPVGLRLDLNDLNDEIIVVWSLDLSAVLALFHSSTFTSHHACTKKQDRSSLMVFH